MNQVPSADRPGVRSALLVLIVAVLATFGPLLMCEFTNWDDPHTVASNAYLQPVSFATFVFHWTTPVNTIYIPLTYSVWAFVALFAQVAPGPDGIGLNPMFFHAANVLFHAAAAMAAFMLLRRLMPGNLAALVGALVFALHPVQVESVGWVSGLKDVLAGGLLLAAMWQYAEFLASGSRRAYLFAIGTAALALLAKPSAMMGTALLFVIEWFWLLTHDPAWNRRPGAAVIQVARTAWRRLLPFALLMIPIALVARMAQPADHVISPLWARPLVVFDAISFYLYKIAFPLHLSLDYGRRPETLIASGAIWYGWIPSALALGVATLLARRGKPAAAAAMMLLVLAPLPVLGLVRFDFEHYSTVADHYLYLAIIGPALLAAWLVTCYGKPAAAIFGVVLAIWAVRSFIHTGVWHDSFSLLQHTDRMNPDSRIAAANLASEHIAAGRFALAEPYHARSLLLDPNNPVIQSNAARLAFNRGQLEEGRAAMNEVARLFEKLYGVGDPRCVRGYLWAAEIAMKARLLDDAERYIRSAEQISPGNPAVEKMRRWHEKVLRDEQLRSSIN